MVKEVRVRESLYLLLVFTVVLFSISIVFGLVPSGTQLTPISNATMVADTPANISAFGGNVTEVNIFGYTQTRTWQGYYGNVSGTIQLADASDNVMYNWSVMHPRGEIYASSNNSIYWAYISCFNYSAVGNFTDENATASGNVSMLGMNITQIEDIYNINYTDYDGVNETFRANGGHNNFFIGPLQFETNECLSTEIYDNTGTSVDNIFEEVLLYEPSTISIVYASLLTREHYLGFNNNTYDFQMLVLEDGHGTNQIITPYYFWLEIE